MAEGGHRLALLIDHKATVGVPVERQPDVRAHLADLLLYVD